MSETVIAGRYRLDELLGRGGMSEVWRAEDLELGRDVAIKLLAPDADTARFDREARAVASLAHPNVVQLYDYGESEGRPYMVLECVPAGTLEDRLRDRAPLPDDEA
jgi:eukaryotic-like serine/threonine-protein kinase